MAEASAACDNVQANSKIPVACRTDYFEGVPSMFVSFHDADEANQWLVSLTRQVSGPFCDAANRNGREARVYITVGGGPLRQDSCHPV